MIEHYHTSLQIKAVSKEELLNSFSRTEESVSLFQGSVGNSSPFLLE